MTSLLFHLKWLLVQAALAQTNWFTEYCEALHDDCGTSAPGSHFGIHLAFRVGNTIAGLIGGAATVVFMWGGFKIATSAGNDQGREEGKKIMLIAVTGLILALLAEAIVIFAANVALSFY